MNRFSEFSGIYIIAITPPAQGWPIAMYCPICKETTFVLSRYALKPQDGDYFKIKDVCARNEKHNMELALKPLHHFPLHGGSWLSPYGA